MTTLLLYKDIKPLNREEHQALKLQPSENCAFAADTHLVPVAGLEFFQAARHYPLVFIGEGAQATPIALLGLAQGHNGYLDDELRWQANTYIPAFIRRYPFVLAQDEASNFTVCFDAAFSGWNQQDGRDLFDAEGQNSAYLDEMIQFLQNFTAEMERTRAFVEKLNALELLAPRTIKLTHSSGESFVLSDFLAIDEEKFLALSDEQVLELNRGGFLGWIYAHLMSLGNANQLFDSYLKAKPQAPVVTH
ncbi:SapC family protein [Pseudomonas sp. SL4(2022)]|uniref:SapC family protein n=1 Tax=unclassified Pseudomonas TaxID=196821 RepID=UPI00130487D5|nr:MULTISPECIES: SapC family protein [unclassified Pseudomonas]WAC45419.1 SapC family protein [Pseudomonas sp. SL4(2022)]